MKARRRPVPLPAEGFARLETVLAVFPVNRWAWQQGVKAGRYPAPVRLSPRVVAWRVEDIRALLAEKAS